MSNISKEAIARTQESAFNLMGIVNAYLTGGDREHRQHVVVALAEQVRELDALLIECSQSLNGVLPMCEPLNQVQDKALKRAYDARDKIKQARGE